MLFYKIVIYLLYLPIKLVIAPFKVYGKENIPEGAAVVAGNHTSNFDAPLAVLSMPLKGDVKIIGKIELFRNKLFGWFLKKMGAFPVDRGNNDIAAIKTALNTLKTGQKLLIFPEGTRVKGEEDVGAKQGAALFAMRTGAPVLPMYLTSGKKLFRRTKVIFGKPYYIEGSYKDQENMQRAADEMMEKIFALGEQYES